MFQLIDSASHDQEIDASGEDVKHVHAGDAKERCPKQRRRARPLLSPFRGQLKRSQAFTNQVVPLDRVQDDKGRAQQRRTNDPFPRG